MKFSAVLGAVLASALAGQVAWAAPAADGMRVAFVEVPRLLQDAPQVAAVRDNLKKEFSRRDNDLVALQNEIKKLEQKLQRDASAMSEAETQKVERELVSKQRKLKNAQSEFQEELSLRQNEELNKLRRQIAEVIIEVAKEDNLDLVLETGVVYASNRSNITDKVLERLQRKAK
jgi:outer membrane protein